MIGIKVVSSPDIPPEDVEQYVQSEIELWETNYPGRKISEITITSDGDEVEISACERSPIRRVRRITGYLAPIDAFNDAKQAELRARKKHDY